jgi:hypothetical protein
MSCWIVAALMCSLTIFVTADRREIIRGCVGRAVSPLKSCRRGTAARSWREARLGTGSIRRARCWFMDTRRRVKIGLRGSGRDGWRIYRR